MAWSRNDAVDCKDVRDELGRVTTRLIAEGRTANLAGRQVDDAATEVQLDDVLLVVGMGLQQGAETA